MAETYIRQIREAYAKLTNAHEVFFELCHRQFPAGSLIYWRTRGYVQEGIVQEVYPIRPHQGVYIRAKNTRTGKEIHVRYSDIDWATVQDHLSSVE